MNFILISFVTSLFLSSPTAHAAAQCNPSLPGYTPQQCGAVQGTVGSGGVVVFPAKKKNKIEHIIHHGNPNGKKPAEKIDDKYVHDDPLRRPVGKIEVPSMINSDLSDEELAAIEAKEKAKKAPIIIGGDSDNIIQYNSHSAEQLKIQSSAQRKPASSVQPAASAVKPAPSEGAATIKSSAAY